MTRKIAGNENRSKRVSRKPVAPVLQDDDLQQVAGGLAAGHAAVAIDAVCVSRL